MADNTELSAGSGGDIIATDDLAGVKHQLVKLEFGADGLATMVSATAPLPVQLSDGTDSLLISAGGAALVDGSGVTQPISNAGITTIAGAVSGTEMQVDVVAALPAGTNYVGKVRLTDGTTDLAVLTSHTDNSNNNDNHIDVGAFVMAYNGATWDRVRGDTTNGLDVDVTRLPALAAGTNNIGDVDILSIAAGDNNIGNVDVVTLPALPAGTNNIGDVDVLSIAAGTNAIGNVGVIPRTTGGLTTYHLVSAGSTNATVVKASAGQLFGWYIYNNNASMRKLAFHNSASAPTAGASIFFSLPIPASSGANVFLETGIAFSAGIAFTTVTDITDAGATAVAASDLTINLFYA